MPPAGAKSAGRDSISTSTNLLTRSRSVLGSLHPSGNEWDFELEFRVELVSAGRHLYGHDDLMSRPVNRKRAVEFDVKVPVSVTVPSI